MKIVSIQPRIEPTYKETLEGILMRLEVAARAGASLVLLPELATTGFTGRVAKENRGVVADHILRAIERLKEWSRDRDIVLCFGSLVFPPDEFEKPFNAMLTVFPDGRQCMDAKKHLMEGKEEAFFQRGTTRNGFSYRGIKFDFVICREFRNAHEADALIGEETDVVIWPACIRHNSESQTSSDASEELICDFAKRHRVHVIGSNWANFLDSNKEGNMGGSYAVSPEGEVVLRCKWDDVDMLIYEYEEKEALTGR